MSPEHKAALAVGRSESAAVKRYLEALEQNRPKRGRKRTAESIQKRLDAIDGILADADALTRLNLLQEQVDLENEIRHLDSKVDVEGLEADFVEVAASYAARKKITYPVWRQAGVSADTLKRAGISR